MIGIVISANRSAYITCRYSNSREMSPEVAMAVSGLMTSSTAISYNILDFYARELVTFGKGRWVTIGDLLCSDHDKFIG